MGLSPLDIEMYFVVMAQNLFLEQEEWLLVVLGLNGTFYTQGHIMAVGDAHVLPGFLTPVLTQLFFPKPPTTFLACFCRGERQKYAGKKILLNWGSNSQPPGHESDMLATEPPRLGLNKKNYSFTLIKIVNIS